jgi:hypothetical protein
MWHRSPRPFLSLLVFALQLELHALLIPRVRAHVFFEDCDSGDGVLEITGVCNSSLVECSIGEPWPNEQIGVMARRRIQSCM